MITRKMVERIAAMSVVATCALTCDWSSARGGAITTLTLPAGSSASLIYETKWGDTARFDVKAADQDRSETHETDLLFGWDYGSVKMGNGATLMWCTGVSVLPPSGTEIDVFGLLSVDGPNLLVWGDDLNPGEYPHGWELRVEKGLSLDRPLWRVKDASSVDDVAQLLDPAFVATLPDYSGPAVLQSLGTLRFTERLLGGDFNGDHHVDGADFLAWQQGDAANPAGDANLRQWQENFGATPPLDTVAHAVPEPSTWSALVLSAGAHLSRRRRSTRSSALIRLGEISVVSLAFGLRMRNGGRRRWGSVRHTPDVLLSA